MREPTFKAMLDGGRTWTASTLMGYTRWGCIDLVSAGTGEMKKRYGYDLRGQARTTAPVPWPARKKDSFYWYKKVIATNGEDLA